MDSGTMPRPDPAASPDDTAADGSAAADGLRRLLAEEIGELHAAAPAAAAGSTGAIHRMRVAARRLRAVLPLFATHLDRDRGAALSAGLRDLGRVLGEKRDWDVFGDGLAARGAADAASFDASLAEARARADAARQSIGAALHAPAFGALVRDLATWAGTLPRADQDRRLHDYLVRAGPALLDEAARRARRHGRHFRRRDIDDLHRLRKDVKKLRYRAEFLSPLFPAKSARRFVEGCKDLQDALGRLNDHATWATLAATMGTPPPPVDSAETAALRKAARRRWRDFKDLPEFWGA